MVKHTQTIRRQSNCLSVFDHFVGLALKGLILTEATDHRHLEKQKQLFADVPQNRCS